MELAWLEARIGEELEAGARALWAATAARPDATLGAPPVLTADATRAALARARTRGGEEGARAAGLYRLALGAAFAARDAARARPALGDPAAFRAAAAARDRLAGALGYPDAWALLAAVSGDPDDPLDDRAVAAPPTPAPAPWLDPRAVAGALAAAHGVDAGAITAIDVVDADAPVPGRTFVIAPGRDVRIRIWRRPGAAPAGALRVLLHELGHALLAARGRDRPPGLAVPPSRALDEGVAAWTAAHLERPAFNQLVLGLPAAAADALADAERAARAARRARLVAAARAERAFYRDGGSPPADAPLAWTDPGAAWSYAVAERVRDALDASLGASWPTAPLADALRG